ncbi:MAG TPA: NAD-dependent epimerase/dehydratase family protein, partial [Polyangiaceae bacterium]|jgi:UDP-glucose 4-epimerase
MRVLVTGGAGFIGSHVVEQSLAQGWEVSVIDNLSTGRRHNLPHDAHLYEVDLRDRDATLRAVRDFRPEHVSHQAAQPSVAVSVREPRLDADVNVMGGLNLLDACTAPGVNVPGLVFASTGGAIYGEVAGGHRAAEGEPPNPLSPYAIHKLAFERLLEVYRLHRGLGFTALRYSNVYGPRQDAHGEAGVIAIFLRRALEGKPLTINARQSAGDDGCVRDYVYVSDVARANVLALKGEIHESVVNVATGIGTTTRDLGRRILAVTGCDVELEPAAKRPGDLGRSVLDPSLTERYLGSLVGLDRGLARTHAAFATEPPSPTSDL